MSMTRQHFELVAGVIRDQVKLARARNDSGSLDGVYRVAYDLARKFELQNPRFDRARFMSACDCVDIMEST